MLCTPHLVPSTKRLANILQTFLTVAKRSVALSDALFVTVLTEVCKVLQPQDHDVCEGSIRLQGPALAEAIRNMDIPSKTSQLFCNTISGICPFPEVETPKLSLPPKPRNVTKPKISRRPPIKVVHYSDIHIDPLYEIGSNSNCTKPICCRDYPDSSNTSTTFNPAGTFGSHHCDTPKILEESMYAAIREVAPNAAFALFTGDIVDHAIWNTSIEHNSASITDAYSMMNGFGNVYGSIGNHEQHPANLLQSNAVGNNAHWLYGLLSAVWSRWHGLTAVTTTLDTGFYASLVPGTNLRIISLNTNLFYKMNFDLYTRDLEEDVNGQLAWLVSELSAAETASERVYLIGHMPLGHSDAFRDQSNAFDQIINRFQNTIAGMFFGHTHRDEFMIHYSNYDHRRADTAIAFEYITPSLTPAEAMPAFRVYDVDPVTYAVLDATTYYVDMDDSSFDTDGPKWKKYYSAKEAYGSLLSTPPGLEDELTPSFWHDVTEAFVKDDAAWAKFLDRKGRGYGVAICEDDCKEETICQLRAGRAQDNCFDPHLGLGGLEKSTMRTDAKHTGHGSTCGGSVFRDMFAVGQELGVKGFA